ncbi:MAG: aldo/keto reductase [bacterium]|nr:aldo/keto reductase [bacterium]
METRTLGDTGLVVTPLGIGLAAIGRPGYITLGRDRDLGAARTPDDLRARCFAMLDAARAAGVRYVDAARSYGRAEEFLGAWLRARGVAPGALTVGSKWGYRYTAGWTIDAVVHEEKELSLARFRAQLAESRTHLGAWLDLYEIHSATLESGVLDDQALREALCDARAAGVYRAVGLTLSGPTSAATLARALAAGAGGRRVFDVVQATFNLLEPSLAPQLAAAHAAGLGVIVKEVHANGRLTATNARPADAALVARLATVAAAATMGVDQLAIAWALRHPFVDVVLSGAATPEQLASHRDAVERPLDAATADDLRAAAEPPERYWKTRASLPWS